MRHFSFSEFTKSATASAKGINNMPQSVEIIDNIDRLIDQVLEPLRLAYGKPIHVTSGYRCEALNTAVGGVKFCLSSVAYEVNPETKR